MQTGFQIISPLLWKETGAVNGPQGNVISQKAIQHSQYSSILENRDVKILLYSYIKYGQQTA